MLLNISASLPENGHKAEGPVPSLYTVIPFFQLLIKLFMLRDQTKLTTVLTSVVDVCKVVAFWQNAKEITGFKRVRC
ncbi:hypothetical protein GGTG_08949 [Gaeumannomyces tritici R3-111a-1]|uniref:Uncharacterized protein n=1 Tax=Gaeumannomyces tritici (strain R3-111a-1) TaxID=644352 RepID=J3P609_GAET3|nr:hypothetical protein GGTG_08949 [Gaeumannomyces tritici R3-111a-1]EJT75111.1 hypothetical protein GGTG_08949 [Gaeumannomyces tritici R3-111a-1]